jgi:phosphoglycerol geranylgeranyltransferase
MPGLADIVRSVDSLVTALSIGGRTLLSLDTNPVPAAWGHITKVDPEEDKQLPLAYPLYLSHTSAVSVGGSRDVTEQNTAETFDILAGLDVPAFHEPSEATHVTEEIRDRSAFMAVPEVLNGDSGSLVGTLGKGVEHIKEDVGPGMINDKLPLPLGGTIEGRLSDFAASWLLHEAVFEAYIIMNVDSAAAREANVTEDDLLTPREAKQHAMAAETHLESEVVYLEYSGTFGGDEAVDILESITDGVSWSRLWYGGGLDSRENAQAVLDAGADAVIVGNVFHDIAAEEAELAATAADELGTGADRETIREWLERETDVENSSAARYLSTVVSVPDPSDRALRYLTAGVEVYLDLVAMADDMTDVDAATLREAVANDTVPGESHFADVLDQTVATEVAESLSVSLLAERFGVEVDSDIAAHHVGAEL